MSLERERGGELQDDGVPGIRLVDVKDLLGCEGCVVSYWRDRRGNPCPPALTGDRGSLLRQLYCAEGDLSARSLRGRVEVKASRTKAAAATFLVLSNDTNSSNSISSCPSVFIAFSTCLRPNQLLHLILSLPTMLGGLSEPEGGS